MPEPLISVDLGKAPAQQTPRPHNRWHPDIPPVVTVDPGSQFRVECLDWTGGQIHNDDSANDVRDIDLGQVHYLSGPVAVNGAAPGDLLVVDILDIGLIPTAEWGFTGIFARENGGGFLTDVFPDAHKTIWDLHGIWATSRHIPGVRYAGITHPGLMGTAPSRELLDRWNRREQQLIDTDADRVPPLAQPPTVESALVGQVDQTDAERVASEGARTIPGRENGGNVDIKNLSRGSQVWFPVFVEGGLLSVGDLHFSQGDGEISFCGAIEIPGWIELGVEVIKGGMEKYAVRRNPVFKPGPVEPRYSQFLTFEGISVDDADNQHYIDASLSYRQACLNAIDYLTQFGYTGEQAYMLLSTAPVEGRISGIVDIPNAVATVYVPTEMFDSDISPTADGPQTGDRGQVARAS